MRLTDVPWSELRVGQKVRVSIPLDGVISQLSREPMVSISWEDGNHHEYHRSILGHVELLDEHVSAPTFSPAADHLGWTDNEGE